MKRVVIVVGVVVLAMAALWVTAVALRSAAFPRDPLVDDDPPAPDTLGDPQHVPRVASVAGDAAAHTDAQPPASGVRGSVADESFRTLGGATVEALDLAASSGAPEGAPRVVARTQTGVNGEFRFPPGIVRAGHGLRVAFPGRHTALVWIRDPAEPLHVILDAGARLDVDVRVAGAARPDVRVMAGPPVTTESEAAALAQRGVTDAAGHTELTGLGAGTAVVELRLDALRLRTQRVFLSAGRTTRLAVDLPCSVAVRGRVTSPHGGVPVGRAEIEFSDGTQCVTAPDGAFEAGVILASSEHKAGVVRMDGVVVASFEVGRRSPTDEDVDVGDVPVEPLRTVRGAVLLDGRPCASAAVWLTTPGRGGRPETLRSRTDAEGRFAVRCPATLEIADLAAQSPDGTTSGRVQIDGSALGAADADLGVLDLRPSRDVTVRVEDAATGAAVPHARVLLLGPFAAACGDVRPGKDFDAATSCVAARTAASDGEAHVLVPRGVRWAVAATCDRYRGATVWLDSGDLGDVVRVALRSADAANSVLRGRVVDAGGWSARALVECADGEGRTLGLVATDWAGLFELGAPRGAAVSLVARGMTRPDLVGASVAVDASEDRWIEITATW